MHGDGNGTSPANAMRINDAMKAADSGDILVLLNGDGRIEVNTTLALKSDMKLYSFAQKGRDLNITLGLGAVLTLDNTQNFSRATLYGSSPSSNVITLADNSVLENIILSGGKSGIVADTLTGLTLLNITVSDVGENGVDLSDVSGTAMIQNLTVHGAGADGFSFIDSTGLLNLTDLNISGAGARALRLKASSCPNNFSIKTLEHNGTAEVLDMQDLSSGAVEIIQSKNGRGIIATGGRGILQKDSACSVSFNLPIELSNTVHGVSISNSKEPDSNATFLFNNININNTTQSSILLDTRNVKVNFLSGTVTQTLNNAAILSVASADTTTLEFDEMKINASKGSGLEFIGANGSYNFLESLSLVGTSAGVTIRDGSKGSFRFLNFDLSNTQTSLIEINASSADIHFTNGSISQIEGSGGIAVGSGDKSSLYVKNTDINLSAGPGLIFDSAEGNYSFDNVLMDMNKKVKGVYINKASAYFELINTGIKNTITYALALSGGLASSTLNIKGGDLSTSFGGSILNFYNEDRSIVNISNTKIKANNLTKNDENSQGAIYLYNAKGNYSFSDTNITLEGAANALSIVKESQARVTFKNTSSITSDSTSGYLVQVHDDISRLSFEGSENFISSSSPNAKGILLSNAGGSYDFTGANISLQGGEYGVQIVDNTASLVNFDKISISDTNNTNIILKNYKQNPHLSFNTGTISQTSDVALLEISSEDNSYVLFKDINFSSSKGLSFTDTQGQYNFENVVIETSESNNSLLIQDVLDGNFSFLNTHIRAHSASSLVTLSHNSVPITFESCSFEQKNEGDTINIIAGDTTQLFIKGSTNITNSRGNGFVFNEVKGVYDFSMSDINMTGVQRGIDISNTSDGSFIFEQSTIRGQYSDAVIRLSKSPLSILFLGGAISQEGNGTILGLSSGDESNLSFSSTSIVANGGNGLIFNDLNGSYHFSEASIYMNGSKSGIHIRNISDKASIVFEKSQLEGDSENALLQLVNNRTAVKINSGSIIQKGGGGSAITISRGNIQQLLFAKDTNITISAPKGYGLKLESTRGNYDFSDAYIRGESAKALINFTGLNTISFKKGTLVQKGTGALLSAFDDFNSSVTFTEVSLNATSGQGLDFNGTQGEYDLSKVKSISLDNTTQGINISNASGTFYFANSELNGVKNRPILTKNSSAKVYFLGGVITQNQMQK